MRNNFYFHGGTMSDYGDYCRDIKDSRQQHRDNRLKRFEETILPQLEGYGVTNPTYGKYTIHTPEYGFIDIFPKSNKLLIRKNNKWLNGAEKWVIRNVFKEYEI